MNELSNHYTKVCLHLYKRLEHYRQCSDQAWEQFQATNVLEFEQRYAKYHSLAYSTEEALKALNREIDLLEVSND